MLFKRNVKRGPRRTCHGEQQHYLLDVFSVLLFLRMGGGHRGVKSVLPAVIFSYLFSYEPPPSFPLSENPQLPVIIFFYDILWLAESRVFLIFLPFSSRIPYGSKSAQEERFPQNQDWRAILENVFRVHARPGSR